MTRCVTDKPHWLTWAPLYIILNLNHQVVDLSADLLV